MKKALRLWSWDGQTEIRATEIKSYQDARQKGPFVDHNNKRVSWVNRYLKSNGRIKVSSHFKHPNRYSWKNCLTTMTKEVEHMRRLNNESPVHKSAKEKTVKVLEKLVHSQSELNWFFNNPQISDFTLSGNFLSGVTQVKKEHPLKTPFLDKEYRFDVALLGEAIGGRQQILGAIEFELTSRFESIKCLICKCLGFPLISIDLEGVKEDEITEDWCYKKLIETTSKSNNGLRKNFVYIHNMLYPVYMDIPETVRKDKKHQYIIFVDDNNFEKLYTDLQNTRDTFLLTDNQAKIEPVNRKRIINQAIESTLKNEGSIAGKIWEEYNDRRFFRITIDIPKQKSGNVYKFHLAMTALLNCYYDTLVGYKYERGLFNRDDESKWYGMIRNGNSFERIPIIQKHVSEPIGLILRLLSDIKAN